LDRQKKIDKGGFNQGTASFLIVIALLAVIPPAHIHLIQSTAAVTESVRSAVKALGDAVQSQDREELRRHIVFPLELEKWAAEGKIEENLSEEDIGILLNPLNTPNPFNSENNVPQMSISILETGDQKVVARMAFTDYVIPLMKFESFPPDLKLQQVWDLTFAKRGDKWKLAKINLLPKDFFQNVLQPMMTYLNDTPHLESRELRKQYESLIESSREVSEEDSEAEVPTARISPFGKTRVREETGASEPNKRKKLCKELKIRS
jgi:hypothetical protein